MKDAQRTSGAALARTRLLLIGALLAITSFGALADGAAAAPSKFVYETCDSALPGGNPPAASFVVNPGVPFTPFQTCASPGGSIGISETGPTGASYAYWGLAIAATPGGYVESVTATGTASGLGPGNDHSFAYEQGWPVNNGGESKRVFQNSEGEGPFYFNEPGLRILMNCDTGAAPGGCGAGPTIAINDLAATEVDPKPPGLSVPSGTIFAGGVLRGHQSVSTEASDEGGGLSKVEVLVNGLPGATPVLGQCDLAAVKNRSFEGVVALTPSPCPAKLAAAWTLDTAAPPFQEGANTVEVCASDYSSLMEANRTCSTPMPVSVNDSCTESPVPGGQVISAQFVHTHKEEITVPYDHPATVGGEVADAAGDPIPGATVCVQLQTQGSRVGYRPKAAVTTDAHGHFAYKVPAGPNREVLMGYRHDTFQVAKSIRYYAHIKPTIRLSPGRVENGARIKIRGSLPGRRNDGRVVVLQASVPGSKRWFTFRRATTNKESSMPATASRRPPRPSPTGSAPWCRASTAFPGRSATRPRRWCG